MFGRQHVLESFTDAAEVQRSRARRRVSNEAHHARVQRPVFGIVVRVRSQLGTDRDAFVQSVFERFYHLYIQETFCVYVLCLGDLGPEKRENPTRPF